jgi:hypothetical protein
MILHVSRLLPILLLLTLTGVSHAETFKGTLEESGGVLRLKVSAGSTHVLSGPYNASLQLLVGRSVELEGTLPGPDSLAPISVARVVSPLRDELKATVLKNRKLKIGSKTSSRTLRTFGRTALLTPNTQATFDVWRTAADEVCVIAREAETTTTGVVLLRAKATRLTWFVGWIRGKSRALWVEEESGGFVLVRHGELHGWLRTSEVSVPTPVSQGASAKIQGTTQGSD